MGFWKFPPFLILSILVLYQAGMLHAAPFRMALGSSFDSATLTEEEMSLLLVAMVKDYVQMKATVLEQETEDFSLDSSRAKQCNNLSTCVLGTYTWDVNKFYAFPLTTTGIRVSGKKWVRARVSEKVHYPSRQHTLRCLRRPPPLLLSSSSPRICMCSSLVAL
uniref:Calcitonin n=1 Tax=Sus scrofa TaxID=9823 RepID=A0A761_PIG|nr:calcitonin-2 [Sus scrofa]